MYQRDLIDTQQTATSKCFVTAGALFDPYTATWAWLVRGKSALNQVGVDHVVSLSDAWSTGASSWWSDERNGFYNDPLNLMTVTTSDIASKAGKDASGWLPPNPQGRCLYAIAQVAVKFKYHLWVTEAERSALRKVLAACPAAVTKPRPTSSPPPEPAQPKHVRNSKPTPKAVPRPTPVN
jgi:hypothetical protein